jgi:hypothetical protein
VTRTPIHRSRTSRALPVALLAALALTVGPAPATAAPILLATRDEVPAATAGYLREHAVRSVLLVGGEDALSTSTPDRLRALGTGDVQRVAGADRYATSRAVAAFVPTATHALAVGPWVARPSWSATTSRRATSSRPGSRPTAPGAPRPWERSRSRADTVTGSRSGSSRARSAQGSRSKASGAGRTSR